MVLHITIGNTRTAFKEQAMEKYKCPCCGNYTLTEEPPGTFEICSLCHWEDDNVQFDDPHYAGGANVISLYEAQTAYHEHMQASATPEAEADDGWFE